MVFAINFAGFPVNVPIVQFCDILVDWTFCYIMFGNHMEVS